MTMIRRFFKDRAGSTAIEYGLIAALMAVAVISGYGAVANNVTNTLDLVTSKFGG
jgi:pilus assembly protein Flp/PilA